MTKQHIIFSHGKESGPWGSKITKMAEFAKSICDCEIHSIDYQDLESPDDRVQRLVDYLKTLRGKIILVGSSMGGYVSTVASTQVEVDGLMLLAPAFNLPGYQVQNPTTPCKNLQIIHGWHDSHLAGGDQRDLELADFLVYAKGDQLRALHQLELGLLRQVLQPLDLHQ